MLIMQIINIKTTYQYEDHVIEVSDKQFSHISEVKINDSTTVKEVVVNKSEINPEEEMQTFSLEFLTSDNAVQKVEIDQSAIDYYPQNTVEFYNLINTAIENFDEANKPETIECEGLTYLLAKTDDGWVLKSKSE